MNHEIKLRRHLKNRLNRSNKIRDKQHDNDRTPEIVKEIWTSILIKRDKTLVKKKRSKLYYNSKEIRIKVITSNIYEIRETTIYKKLSRRSTP